MSDHPRIYLQPECCADEEIGRLWCEHDSPEDCENGAKWTEYVLADIAQSEVCRFHDHISRNLKGACICSIGDRDAAHYPGCPIRSRQLVSSFMIANGFETGTAESIPDLLGELSRQIFEMRKTDMATVQLAALMQSLEIPPCAATLNPGQLAAIGRAICEQAKKWAE